MQRRGQSVLGATNRGANSFLCLAPVSFDGLASLFKAFFCMKGSSWFSFQADAKAAATVLKHDYESLGIAQRLRLTKAPRWFGDRCATRRREMRATRYL
jgi:hypothetical protein